MGLVATEIDTEFDLYHDAVAITEGSLEEQGVRDGSRITLVARPGPEKLNEDALLNAFRVVDADGNGFVDVRKWKAILVAEGIAVKNDQLRKLVCDFDADGDGFLNFDEFGSFMNVKQPDEVLE